MKKIRIPTGANMFAEDKDVARKIRMKAILPALDSHERVILDFSGVRIATQSFIHALIGEALKRHGENVLDEVEFYKCNSQVQSIVSLVVDYSLGGFEPYSKTGTKSLRKKL